MQHFGQHDGQQPLAMNASRRCLAKTRRAQPCQSPAMRNGRCRMHGGLSTGAPKGNQNALKHGLYSAAAIVDRAEVRALIREFRELEEEIF